MFFRLLAAFILIPIVELYLMLALADATSVLVALAIVIGTGILGSYLARREGAIAWFRFQSALSEGRMPSREIQDGLMIVFAAAMLLTPGLLTDGVGFMMLVPAGRDLIRRFVLSRFIGSMNVQVFHAGGTDEMPPSPADSSSPHYVQSERGSSKTIDATSFHKTQ
ncbi:phage T7 F exclusion suppressor FxsA [Novipirellula galeiformis]|uniref:Phage T7 F exclusion suppressor FxsA n=1 Tax=Novipirellula galeiformis TaxID=2528004 RepID=A0A5C6CU20_9BACT|nr:FxsA family protein [Novipirellula galeiformis]TWU26239.1 phage T7 F exclusion suppressor FxsA [Novipirellula galeiformis]